MSGCISRAYEALLVSRCVRVSGHERAMHKLGDWIVAANLLFAFKRALKSLMTYTSMVTSYD